MRCTIGVKNTEELESFGTMGQHFRTLSLWVIVTAHLSTFIGHITASMNSNPNYRLCMINECYCRLADCSGPLFCYIAFVVRRTMSTQQVKIIESGPESLLRLGVRLNLLYR